MADVPGRRTALAVAAYTLGRWQASVLVIVVSAGIAITILALGANPLIIAAWLLLGLVGLAGMVLVSFRDERTVEEATAPEIDLDSFHTPELRDAVRRAREYREAIRRSVDDVKSPEMRASLATITRHFDDPAWLIYTLGQRIEAFRRDTLIQNDLARLRTSARSRKLSAADAEHLQQLEGLEDLVREASDKINATLAQLGASYAEVQTIGAAGDIRGGRIQQALEDLEKQSGELTAIRSALDEVYAKS